LFFLQPAFEIGKLAVPEFGCAIEVVFTLGFFDFDLSLLDLLSERPQPHDRLFFGLPSRLQRIRLRLQISQLFFEFASRCFDALSFSFLSASRSISSCIMRRMLSSSS